MSGPRRRCGDAFVVHLEFDDCAQSVTPEGVAAAIGVEIVGATIQGLFGFGINLLAAPLLVLVDPKFAPGPVVLASMVGSLLVAIRERGRLDRFALGWALLGRVPGTAVGAVVVLVAIGSRLRPVVGIVVLIAVGVSLVGFPLQRQRGTLVGIGVVSGVMNMVAGLGGAPFGLACQDMPGPVLRPTLASFVLLGGSMSALALWLGGDLSLGALRLTVVLSPGVLAGFGLSYLLVPLADRKAVARVGVLLIATVGAVIAVMKGPW